ncbi:hypothetical protein DEO72_LG10g1564 [Vigna unguiculata]|uniref:Uncharacterized protein n=1 Tax=Vigna unguiculata TaxID=3917 RepID=A0A4D6NC52_VIGUN|nr:hypothetical protein DEO72_LG10g1564 [Vigna unguiculata]
MSLANTSRITYGLSLSSLASQTKFPAVAVSAWRCQSAAGRNPRKPPGASFCTAKHQVRSVATTTSLDVYRLVAHPAPPSAIPVTQCYWFLAL